MNNVLKRVSHNALYTAKPIAVVMVCLIVSLQVKAQTKDTSLHTLMEVVIEHHKQEGNLVLN